MVCNCSIQGAHNGDFNFPHVDLDYQAQISETQNVTLGLLPKMSMHQHAENKSYRAGSASILFKLANTKQERNIEQ